MVFGKLIMKEKKDLVDTALKGFVIEKIAQYDLDKYVQAKSQTDITVNELVEILGDSIPKEDHFDTIRHLTHYILGLAGGLQGYSIIWSDDKSEEFLDNPAVSFNDRGYWDELRTHEQSSYVKTFEFAYDIFKQNILGKGPKQPQLTIIKTTLPKSDN